MMTKDEILQELEEQRTQFLELIDDLPDEALEEPGVVGDWSIKDIMSHITRWEAELVKMLWQLAHGDRPSTVHFTKVSVDQLNADWYQDGRGRDMEQIMDDFELVRKQTIRRMDEFTDKDLNDPDRFPALSLKDKQPLAVWIENDSFGHEAEHIEQIRAWRKDKGYS